MAFGVSPKHIEEFNLKGLPIHHFLVLATETAKNLEWDISHISEKGFIAYTSNSLSSWEEEIAIKIEDEAIKIKSECTGNQFTDWGRNKKNIEDFFAAFEEIELNFTEEEFEERYLELSQNFATTEEDLLRESPLSNKEKVSGFISIFKPTEGYYVTPILIILNVSIFILMLLAGVHILTPESQDLINWGANFKPYTLDGGWLRLLTSCFLHAGILHLLLNMYALLYIGVLLEPLLGKSRFLSAYLISGIAASLASLWWNDLTVSVGASGAIFGMYGVLLALLLNNIIGSAVKKAMLTSISFFIGYNILYGIRTDSGIDNAAHIGGLLSGVVIGYALIPSLKNYNNTSYKYSTIGGLSALLLGISFVMYSTLPNDIGKYNKEMQRFASMEAMAIEVLQLPQNIAKEEALKEIKDKGIYYWNENLKLINNLIELDLPEVIQERNKILREYCEIRIKSYQLIYKGLEEETDIYQNEILQYNAQIENIINSLNSPQ
ncbi:rhomboid family intramembrane serine protease [Chondrinema litorale]|uniref:rhomboid family intramembrane serine protease n=1 Tax=Chondrinema litorale TaxID=2994555 RepID=UPI0025432CBA|nr:rhomboid family intramembrane serine protease [Chondrinema litorale]UZR95247.1 rhomboid family intramembrane serine protease [Chondrinema litorale]